MSSNDKVEEKKPEVEEESIDFSETEAEKETIKNNEKESYDQEL